MVHTLASLNAILVFLTVLVRIVPKYLIEKYYHKPC